MRLFSYYFLLLFLASSHFKNNFAIRRYSCYGAFIKAVDENNGAYIKKLLKTRPLFLNFFDATGRTLLNRAISKNSYDAVVTLTSSKRININKINGQGFTALHEAIIYNNKKIINYLVGLKINLDIKDFDGWTPLHWAVARNNQEIIDLLIRAGANKSVKNNKNQTPVDFIKKCKCKLKAK